LTRTATICQTDSSRREAASQKIHHLRLSLVNARCVHRSSESDGSEPRAKASGRYWNKSVTPCPKANTTEKKTESCGVVG
jgi:hypothetical protein